MEDANFSDFFEEGFEEETEQIIEYLVSQGAAEWDGMDEYGERMFRFNLDVLKEVMPELYNEIMGDVDSVMMELFQQGLVDIEYTENLEAMFKISEKAKQILDELGISYLLPEED